MTPRAVGSPRVSDEPRLVSVVIPSYNRARLLPRAVNSVLGQTYPTIEIIIVDDGSSDDTPLVAAELVGEDPRVQYRRVPHRGAARARNVGIGAAKGDFLAFQDTDDEWDPEFIQRLLPQIVEDECAVAFSSHRLVGPDGKESIVPHRAIRNPRRRLAFGNVVSTQTVLMWRSLLAECGEFDESLPRFQDWDLWIQFLTKRSAVFRHVPTVLATLYRQPDSISAGRELDRMRALARILVKHAGFFILRPFALLWLVLRILLGPLRDARRWLLRAVTPE